MAEEMGLLVWSEIPVYWTIQWDNPETYANAESQLVDMITRDKNRANVVIWSVANETPHGDARLKFLGALIAKAREMDPTRLVSAAMEKSKSGPDMLTVKDDLAELVDLISFNQYVGWYDGTSEKCDRVNWSFDIKNRKNSKIILHIIVFSEQHKNTYSRTGKQSCHKRAKSKYAFNIKLC